MQYYGVGRVGSDLNVGRLVFTGGELSLGRVVSLIDQCILTTLGFGGKLLAGKYCGGI